VGDLISGLLPVLLFEVSQKLLLFAELVFEAALEGFGHCLIHLSCAG
jgi:hypothetical protein